MKTAITPQIREYYDPFMPSRFDHLDDAHLAEIVGKLEVACAALRSIFTEHTLVEWVDCSLFLYQNEQYRRREGIPEWLWEMQPSEDWRASK